MSRKSPKAIAASKSQTTQQTTDLQPETLYTEELVTQEPVSLASQILPIGNTPNPNAHAAIINRAAASPQSSQQVVLQLQRQYGNRYVNRVLQQTRQLQTPIQAKLTLGAVGDKYEQEADRIAKQVVNQIQTSQSPSTTQTAFVQREMMPEEDELQRKPVDIIQREGVLDEENELGMNAVIQRSPTAEGGAITPDLETSIQQARGRGHSLPDSIRQPMEQAFGTDFSGVKIHTDTQSDQLNQLVQAKAFTTGKDIFFRQGEYSPGSLAGQELLAHELTHVVQQNDFTTQPQEQRIQREGGERIAQVTEMTNTTIVQKYGVTDPFLRQDVWNHLKMRVNAIISGGKDITLDEVLETFNYAVSLVNHHTAKLAIDSRLWQLTKDRQSRQTSVNLVLPEIPPAVTENVENNEPEMPVGLESTEPDSQNKKETPKDEIENSQNKKETPKDEIETLNLDEDKNLKLEELNLEEINKQSEELEKNLENINEKKSNIPELSEEDIKIIDESNKNAQKAQDLRERIQRILNLFNQYRKSSFPKMLNIIEEFENKLWQGLSLDDTTLIAKRYYQEENLIKLEQKIRELANNLNENSEIQKTSSVRVIIDKKMQGWENTLDPSDLKTLNKAIEELNQGGVYIESGQWKVNLSMRGHMQGTLIKVYIDEARMGGGTVLRAIFRVKKVEGMIVAKLIAIIQEHGVNRQSYKTLYGNANESVKDQDFK